MGDRHRCLMVGCNPKLKSRAVAEQHREQTGHRIARWPKRSAEGERKQRERNRQQYLNGELPWGFGYRDDGQVDFEAEAARQDGKE